MDEFSVEYSIFNVVALNLKNTGRRSNTRRGTKVLYIYIEGFKYPKGMRKPLQFLVTEIPHMKM